MKRIWFSRHIKMNLKNCLNIGSERSAVDTAFMYSLVESCRANNISPVRYIRFLVDKLSDKTVDRTTLLPCYCAL
ncbi:MAG: transposase [Bacteroides sp.]|nr:transposase [Bacteroides sp.]